MQMKKWKDTVTVSENAQTAEDRTGRILLGVAVILGALYLFFYRHYDCEAITSWDTICWSASAGEICPAFRNTPMPPSGLQPTIPSSSTALRLCG